MGQINTASLLNSNPGKDFVTFFIENQHIPPEQREIYFKMPLQVTHTTSHAFPGINFTYTHALQLESTRYSI